MLRFLYDECVKKVFKPALVNLPKGNEVESKIRRGLKGERDLTQFCLGEGNNQPLSSVLLVDIFKDAEEKYRFRLRKTSGEVVVVSEPYDSFEECRKGVNLFKGLNLMEQ